MMIRRKHGFAFVEMLIVLTIMGMFMAVATHSYLKVIGSGRAKVCLANQKAIFNAATMWYALEGVSLQASGGRAEQMEALVDKGYLENSSYFKCPSGDGLEVYDYELTYEANGDVEDIECQVDPEGHKWP